MVGWWDLRGETHKKKMDLEGRLPKKINQRKGGFEQRFRDKKVEKWLV